MSPGGGQGQSPAGAYRSNEGGGGQVGQAGTSGALEAAVPYLAWRSPSWSAEKQSTVRERRRERGPEGGRERERKRERDTL
jgi:hypothetical protein